MKKNKGLLFLTSSAMLMFSLLSCGNPQGGNVAVQGVSLDENALTLSVDGSYTLTPTFTPNNATNKNVTWSSNMEDVALVDDTGKVMGVSEGEATITVTTVDGGFTDNCVVTVVEGSIAVTSVTLNYDSASIYVGKSLKLSHIVYPVTASNKNVTWSSSDESVATVTDGLVSALAEGSTTITVTTVDGGHTASCEVTVSIEPVSGDAYVPNYDDPDIFFVLESTLESYTPDSKGAYEIPVSGSYKQIYVKVPDVKLTLSLQGVTVENSENSPIYVSSCDSIDISAKNGTTNVIKDTREIYTQEDDAQGKGAVYVYDGDLTFKGKGQLDISASYYNGVHGKDDVEIKNLTLNVSAVNHGIRGNDSITIESGVINVSCGGDGLHTENSDISSKGNQRGNVTISGGTITINSWNDAIQAAHNVEITDGTFVLNTNERSTYQGEKVEKDESKLYIKMSSSVYSSGSYTYAAYINEAWYKATYKGTITNEQGGWPGRPGPGGPGGGGGPGGQTTYYVYELEKPETASSFVLYRFSGSNVTSFSLDNYNAKSDATTFNSNYDMIQISSVYNKKISFSGWSKYEDNISAKGIKAENVINISGGTFNINALDDGIHANNDGSLENGETPLGNVNIAGGDITIKSGDDGVHADGTLTISGGVTKVTESYEGLEGNIINITGGEAYAYGSDDGMNAGSGKSTPSINISGGFVDIEVPTNGDTDGIDSNGNLSITGGVVIVKGPGTAGSTGSMASAVDADGIVSITSGSLIVFGGLERNPTSSVTKTLCTSNTVSVGSHTVSFTSESYSTTLKSSCRGCIVYSSLGSASLS